MIDGSTSTVAPRVFNTPLECGLRLLFVLVASSPRSADLQRLISYDYLLVHSGDVEDGPHSLHPAVPFRGTEWLIKRDLVRSALDLMFAREVIDKFATSRGIYYRATELTKAFVGLLKAGYAGELHDRAQWLADRFGAMSDDALNEFMEANVGRWGAEFEHLTTLRELEL